FVTFGANIVPDTANVLIATMTGLANKKVPEVHLLLSTPGGDVAAGITIYNMLRGLPYKLITHNVGNVDSIGNAIFLAGDERYACKSATFMYHGVGFNAGQNARFEEKLLRERLDSLMMNQERIAAIIEDRTSLTAEEIAPLFLEAQTKKCDWAVK